jgi:hypothetical protein
MSHHIVLIGDSSFDNGAYTGGEPDVCGHLQAIVPAPWRASRLAVDGSTIADVGAQLRAVPDDASHLVLSVGGNDVLKHWGVLRMPAATNADALMEWASRVAAFEDGYRELVTGALTLSRPMTVCTIYNGRLESVRAEPARLALRLFNDAVLRVAFAHHLSVIDLRLVCDDPSDYATPIEPSGAGGLKIATAIAAATGASGASAEGAWVFGGDDGSGYDDSR